MIPPLSAEPIFKIGEFTVTNALINGWIALVFFVLIGVISRRRKTEIPRCIYNLIEAAVEFCLNEIKKVTSDEARARRFFPLVASIFFFVLFSNWFGLLPGTGSIGIYQIVHGSKELVPILRPAASDLNLTLAIAVFSIFTTHIVGLASLGAVSHISKFLNIRGIVHSLKKGPMQILISVIEFAVGLLEIVSEFAKTLSLSLRLFGNIFAGEVLITVISGMFAFILPVPFMFLELLVGIVQATVFAMLVLAFLTVATSHHGEAEEAEAH